MNVIETAKSLRESERLYIRAVDHEAWDDAGMIAWRTRAGHGAAFAGFAKAHPELFERKPNGYCTAYVYRLSPFGREVRDHLSPGKGDAR